MYPKSVTSCCRGLRHSWKVLRQCRTTCIYLLLRMLRRILTRDLKVNTKYFSISSGQEEGGG